MQKQEIEIAGYKITQLSKTEFEAENKEQNLDFYFEVNDENEIDVFVFDTEVKYTGRNANIEACITSFQSSSLTDAVSEAMSINFQNFN